MCSYCDGQHSYSEDIDKKEFVNIFMSNTAIGVSIYIKDRIIDFDIPAKYCFNCGCVLKEKR